MREKEKENQSSKQPLFRYTTGPHFLLSYIDIFFLVSVSLAVSFNGSNSISSIGDHSKTYTNASKFLTAYERTFSDTH